MLGIARGSGWQNIGAYVNLGAYYLVGIPLAALLGFVFKLRGKGLWIGIVTGTTLQALLLSLVTTFTNWQKQVKFYYFRAFLHQTFIGILFWNLFHSTLSFVVNFLNR